MKQHILTTTVVLLTLSVHISAQNRGPKEALEGLSAIGVVVKYDNADGLDIAMQPNTLQILQDRATDRLSQAGISLVQQTEDADTVGRPRLVFTVTLNKQTETAPAVRVQGKLYERVRLWRDPAKEMELATWVMSGNGYPKVTEEMIVDVFDGQLDEFIKAYRAVNPSRPGGEIGAADPSVQLRDSADTLQGLNGVRLFVSFRPDRFADAHRPALQKMLQSEAENKFKEAGIPVHRYVNESEKAGRPLLTLFITLSHPNSQSHAPAIEVESEFWQRVRPVRNPRKEVYAVTWENSGTGGFAKTDDGAPAMTDEAVRKVLNSQLDEFIKAYNTANLKLSPQGTAKTQ